MAQVEVTNIQGYVTITPARQVEVTNVQGYVLYTKPNQVSMRDLRGYVMASGFSQVGLRTVGGYVMTTPASPLPLGVTGKQAVLNMIVARSKITRPTTDFTIDAPAILTGDDFFNATVKANATASSGLLGSTTFRYNRVKLSRMNLVSSAFDLGLATTIYGLIPALNAASGLVLTTDDIEDGPIATTDLTVTLKAKASSYWFIPGDTLVIGKSLPSINIPISSDTIDW